MPYNRIGATATTSAFTFVLMMGVVNLLADLTYEGASSINGPFLGTLGASAAAIGIITCWHGECQAMPNPGTCLAHNS